MIWDFHFKDPSLDPGSPVKKMYKENQNMIVINIAEKRQSVKHFIITS